MIDLIEQMPGFLAWKDKSLSYLGCNQNYAKALGLKNPHHITGLGDQDFTNVEKSLSFYRESDHFALQGETFQLIHNIGSPDPSKNFYLEKKPLYDQAKNIVGVILHCHEFKNDFIASLNNYDQNKISPEEISTGYHLSVKKNKFNLSARELECLFLTFRGMTAKKIAEIIGLSKRTVEFYLENIKNKFGCQSKSELLVLAIKNEYMNIIPARFLNSNLPASIFDLA